MSFDDGLSQDKQLVELFDKYKIKGTFNLNSGKISCKALWLKDQIGKEGEYIGNDEIASHSLTHPNPTDLNIPKGIYFYCFVTYFESKTKQ